MIRRLKDIYYRSSLATKIRYSYLFLLIPLLIFLVFTFYNLWDMNHNYEDMVNSTVVASEFSLDFKKDFDYETYLLIVGNKTVEESELDSMIEEAERIVAGLEEITEAEDNIARLDSVNKYLSNLRIYVDRIEENLQKESHYEDNMEIWENDVQIVTSLVGDTMSQYIYYEVRGIQQSRAAYQTFFMNLVRFSLLGMGLLLLLVIILSYYIPRSITMPITRISRVTNQVAKGNLSVRAAAESGAEARMLSDSLNAMIDKINELLDQVTTEQIRLRKAEFELLQAQINPHFLYNTLDTIVWLAEAGDQKRVVSMVGNLSDFFRTSLNQGKDIISIREELAHVRSYLEIQQVRYQDILRYEITVPEDLYEYKIPKITIQPLVENALYHGIKNKRGQGTITVTGKSKENGFVLYVRDNGIGMTQERLNEVRAGIQKLSYTGKEIYGLYNVNERIRLNFGETYGISIESTYGEGTCVSISLPDQWK
ncbi:sensor histidine kinase [Lachnospiraceae bacterium OM04-12BH]|jgi:two-component system sensor histidine kinase YesM|nr:sensor histidine kinase [Lachnospiraceae bacterium OM04-12BH]